MQSCYLSMNINIFFTILLAARSKGLRSGESARLPPKWPRFKSWHRHHMWVDCVVGSLLYSERFFRGTPVFPSPQKPTFPNSDLTRNQVDEEPLCECATSKSLFIYFMYLFYLSPSSFVLLSSRDSTSATMVT